MINFTEKITTIISAVILLTTCTSYAQSGSNVPGYWDIMPGMNENTLPDYHIKGAISLNDSVAGDSWGEPIPAEISEPSDGAYFPSSIFESKSALVDEAVSRQYNQAFISGDSYALPERESTYYSPGVGASNSIFWIVSVDGSMHWRSVNIPYHSYARLFLIPAYSGQLIMEERYPNGKVLSNNFGYAKASNKYRAWFFADTPGIHLLRFRIDQGPYSDVLTVYVANYGTKICPCCGQIIYN